MQTVTNTRTNLQDLQEQQQQHFTTAHSHLQRLEKDTERGFNQSAERVTEIVGQIYKVIVCSQYALDCSVYAFTPKM